MENFTSLNVLMKEFKHDKIKTDNIFILAGGQLKNGDINSWVKERLNIGKRLYDINKSAIIYCIGGGTYHKTPICNEHGHVIHESKSCSNYLIKNGVDSNKIKREWGSYDTIANGFFSFLNFIIPLKLKEIVVITSKFHIARATVIFNYFNSLFKTNIEIKFIGVENIIDEELLKIRQSRENQSVQSFQKILKNKKTIEEFFEWFYVEHNAYNCSEYIKESVRDNVKASY